ncbi:TetR/AcrR family transcriptional regulator [Actinoallomurus iriomotensis]|uniref:TetR family transcriptional regulator n=1 Tax=Actinoallomurus iriomotensis TaxID=478107 RepID=A0A9W6SAF5_9ACTN|nr:TetR/AcrR family transcriptional regulator [Actinoallomurus iriomotensis]GLY89999.1 TetR family transcriptional regulator [Actinoallomurus iriomotensis]
MQPQARHLRADAARNRDKLLASAVQVFGERGLDAPLEEIARRAKVSIGTLYNHFPTRQDLVDAILPERLSDLERITTEALADPDPWEGFVRFLGGLFELQARDHGLNDALARRFPDDSAVGAACRRGFAQAELIVGRARESGRLRADFETRDLVPLMWAMSQVIRESMEAAPEAWRRHLAFVVDGLRADSARTIAVPPLTDEQLEKLMRGR